MLAVTRSRFAVAALAALGFFTMLAQAFGGWGDCCCRVCCQPRCCCPVTVVQQPVVQQRDVVTTEYRSEPIVETVPSTLYENVMVDEGSYQTVWVPRMTTRSVARTVYQTRTAYRSVPYQVTRRVSEYSSGGYAYSTLPYSTAPVLSAAPIAPYAPATSSLVPDPRPATPISSAATPIAPRHARVDAGSSNAGYSDIRSADRSFSSPAPSAAQVWRTMTR